MTAPKHLIIALVSSLLISFSSLSAQASASTNPVGFVSTEIFNGDDVVVGLQLERTSVYQGSVSSVLGNVVSLLNANLDVLAGPHYMLVVSSFTPTMEGKWFEIQSNNFDSLTLVDNVQSLGLTSSDIVKITPFWTLSELFPSGKGVGVSSDPFSPVSFVMIPDLTSSGVNLARNKFYFYHDGSSPIVGNIAGWYDNDNIFGGTVDSLPLSPETYIAIRNQSGANQRYLMSGAVPVSTYSTNIVRLVDRVSQDNALVNPYPKSMTLSESGLKDVIDVTTNPFSPTDLILLYVNSQGSGTNVPPSKVYFYHDGSSSILGNVAGWYDNDNIFGGVVDNSVSIPGGGAFVVRKSSSGLAETRVWNPQLPYNLE